MRLRSNAFFQLSRRPDRLGATVLRAALPRRVPFDGAVSWARRVPFISAVLLTMTPSPAFYFVTLVDIAQRAAHVGHVEPLSRFQPLHLTQI
jgi:hypothetical protein